MLSSPQTATKNTSKPEHPVSAKANQDGHSAAGLNASASVFVPGGPVTSSAPDTGQHQRQQQHHHGGRGQQQGQRGGRGGGRRGGDSRSRGGVGGGLSRALQHGTERANPQQQSPRPHHDTRSNKQQQQQRGGQQQPPSQQQPTPASQQQQQQQQREATHDGAQLDHKQPQQHPGRSSGGGESEGELRPSGSSGSTAARGGVQGGRGRQSANHLLNFQYETRGPPRGGRGGRGGGSYGGGRRRPPAYRPQRYDKDKFLQANFRFLVSSAVDTKQFESDADRMFDWDDVIMVDMRSATPVQCPISLDSPPVCPQITPCGHVFSFGSIMRHLMTHGGEQLRRSAPCPLCYQPLVARELRLVQIRHLQPPAVGDTITFQLLRRPKSTIIPLPVAAEPAANEDDSSGSVAAAAATAVDTAAAAAAVGSLDSTTSSSGGAATSKWAARKAATAAGPGAGAGVGSASIKQPHYSSVRTPLSDNLFAKFATLSDPRPLWRAAARELGVQLAEVLAQGGLEADLEAPGLFAAADCLAHRSRKFAEHMATQLLHRGPVGQAPAAGGAGPGSAAAAAGWPVWLADDPQVAGTEADTLIRDAFTVAIDSGKAALTAAEQEQQVSAAFPSLSATVGSPASPQLTSRSSSKQQQGVTPAPAAAGGGSLSAAKAPGSTPRQQQPQVPASTVQAPVTPETSMMERQGSRPELFFDHAFSEDEEDEQQAGPGADGAQMSPADDSSSRAAPGEEGGPHSAARNIPGTSASGAESAAAAAAVFGTSPGTSGVLGSSPTTSAMNTANLSGDYYMYQAADGQWLFLHPINLRCLLHAFGSYASCPATVTGKVLELEDIVQDEGSRRRWRFLGHLPLNGTFRLGEVAFTQPALTPAQLAPLAEELAARDKRRKRRAEAARRESRREAAAAAAAAKARQGPSAAELRSMPRLGQAEAAAEGGVGGAAAAGVPADLQGLSPEQLEEALAAQAMHDSTADVGGAAYGASPPAGGVSFARIAELGFAATGPALGSSPAAAAAGSSTGPPAVAVGGAAALKGAWGAASSSGKSAAARLSGTPGGAAAGSSSSTAASGGAAAAGLLTKSNWGTSGATAASGAAARVTAGASGQEGGAAPGSQQWLVLGGREGSGRDSGAAEGAGEASGAAAASSGGGGSSSSSSKKSKKGIVLFATGQQRRY